MKSMRVEKVIVITQDSNENEIDRTETMTVTPIDKEYPCQETGTFDHCDLCDQKQVCSMYKDQKKPVLKEEEKILREGAQELQSKILAEVLSDLNWCPHKLELVKNWQSPKIDFCTMDPQQCDGPEKIYCWLKWSEVQGMFLTVEHKKHERVMQDRAYKRIRDTFHFLCDKRGVILPKKK